MNTTPPETPEPPETEPVPTWSRDLRRVLGICLFGALFMSLFVLLASTGLMRAKGSLDTLEADAVWAGICAGLLVIMFPVLLFDTQRVDDGFRRHGPEPLVVLRVIAGGVTVTRGVLVWRPS